MPSLGRALYSAVVSLVRSLASIAILSWLAQPGLLPAAAQNSTPGPNSDPNYQALRNLTLGGEAVSVSNFDLKRDAGRGIQLRQIQSGRRQADQTGIPGAVLRQ